ncbi:hypothetical protein MTO96_003067 [Rhipicephalus appendiculatus]
MMIKFDVTRRQERPLIVGFQADGQRYVELQEGTTAPSLLETIADIAGATVDSLVELAAVVAVVNKSLMYCYFRHRTAYAELATSRSKERISPLHVHHQRTVSSRQ